MTTATLARIPGTPPGLSLDVLRTQLGAPHATDAEVAHFALVCNRLDLSPWADQIVLIGRRDKRSGGGLVHRHQITVAGRRTLATRTGRPYRVAGPVWCGPRNDRGDLVWREVWDSDDEHPYAAQCLVYFAEFTEPAANGTAKWSEFAQYVDADRIKLAPTWQRMPSHMLGKVAESMALRRAFPDVIDPAVADDFPLAIADVDDVRTIDDVAELVEAEAPDHRDLRSSFPVRGLVRADWVPTSADQGEAHKTIAALDDDDRASWLHHWDIEDFSEVWPAAAVADAIGVEIERTT